MKSLEVFFTPADFVTLKRRNLDDTVCVVFDVFRATSTMIAALANGAPAIIPVGEISEALELRRKNPGALLAGERDGLRIRAELSGGRDFDLGNSPREFTPESIDGRAVVMSTTNGTRALRACAHALKVLIGSFLNLKATADFLAQERPDHLLVIGSGTFEQAAYEDVLAAGALCDLLWSDFGGGEVSDGALMARKLYQQVRSDLPDAASSARNGRRLLGRSELRDDVSFCLQQNLFNFAACLGPDGKVRIV